MHGDFLTCMGTYGNGAKTIGLIDTLQEPALTRWGRLPVANECCVAGAGKVRHSLSDLRTDFPIIPWIKTASSVSVVLKFIQVTGTAAERAVETNNQPSVTSGEVHMQTRRD